MFLHIIHNRASLCTSFYKWRLLKKLLSLMHLIFVEYLHHFNKTHLLLYSLQCESILFTYITLILKINISNFIFLNLKLRKSLKVKVQVSQVGKKLLRKLKSLKMINLTKNIRFIS